MSPKYIDIHSHLHFPDYDKDRREVVERTKSEGCWVINVGTDIKTSESAVGLAEQEGKGFFATIGLHPTHTEEIFDFNIYKKLGSHPKVVAIGECGLDYFRLKEETKEGQKKVFAEQIRLANELKKPLMCHVRTSASLGTSNAYADAYEILKAEAHVPANMHFFAGTWDEAKIFLDIGCTLSFTGVLTFARNYDEVVKNMPLERIMAETDCPFVAPAPYRGKRNEPLYVTEVYKAIANIRGEDEEAVREAIVQNAKRVFMLS